MLMTEHRSRLQEIHAIGNPVTNEEVRQGRYGKVTENLRQRVDLVLMAHGAHFQEGKPGVHGQHHHGAQQNEECVGAVDQSVHRTLQVFHGIGRPFESTKTARRGSFLHQPGSGERHLPGRSC
ncbi:hypothetical protein D3C81_362800 [compost metagenome]